MNEGADVMKLQTRLRVVMEHDFDEIYRKEGARLWRALFAYTGGRRDLAEEAISEAFTRAIERADSIRDPVAWIYRTATHVALRELKIEGATRKRRLSRHQI
jgi:DNA-directed RNA polymerase specialized sigma24 family protein